MQNGVMHWANVSNRKLYQRQLGSSLFDESPTVGEPKRYNYNQSPLETFQQWKRLSPQAHLFTWAREARDPIVWTFTIPQSHDQRGDTRYFSVESLPGQAQIIICKLQITNVLRAVSPMCMQCITPHLQIFTFSTW